MEEKKHSSKASLGQLEHDLARMSEINQILKERNEQLNDENEKLRQAITKLELFQKASDLKARDVIISSNKFGELFVVLRNNMRNGTDAIICRVNESGSEVVGMMPRKKA